MGRASRPRGWPHCPPVRIGIWLLTTGQAFAINPVGLTEGNQDYIDLANSDDHFLAVGLVGIPGAACSGAWLGGEYVLTARHCGGGDESVTFTFANGTAIGSQEYWASELPANVNDLAIVRLASTPSLPANYLPGRIRPTGDGIVGEQATLVGYGGIGRSAGHNVFTNAGDTGEIHASRPAATGLELGANLIPGDSGGPVFVQEADGSYSIVGVASVIFGSLDIWANAITYAEQIEFGMQTNNFGFFQQGLPAPLMGDLTLDGLVDVRDRNAFLDGWLSVHDSADVDAWRQGDLNGDHITDLADMYLLREALANAGLPPFVFIPEPASAVSLLVLCLGFATRPPNLRWRR